MLNGILVYVTVESPLIGVWVMYINPRTFCYRHYSLFRNYCDKKRKPFWVCPYYCPGYQAKSNFLCPLSDHNNSILRLLWKCPRSVSYTSLSPFLSPESSESRPIAFCLLNAIQNQHVHGIRLCHVAFFNTNLALGLYWPYK